MVFLLAPTDTRPTVQALVLMELATPEAEKRSDADSSGKDVSKFVQVNVHLESPLLVVTYIVHLWGLRARVNLRSHFLHKIDFAKFAILGLFCEFCFSHLM